MFSSAIADLSRNLTAGFPALRARAGTPAGYTATYVQAGVSPPALKPGTNSQTQQTDPTQESQQTQTDTSGTNATLPTGVVNSIPPGEAESDKVKASDRATAADTRIGTPLDRPNPTTADPVAAPSLPIVNPVAGPSLEVNPVTGPSLPIVNPVAGPSLEVDAVAESKSEKVDHTVGSSLLDAYYAYTQRTRAQILDSYFVQDAKKQNRAALGEKKAIDAEKKVLAQQKEKLIVRVFQCFFYIADASARSPRK